MKHILNKGGGTMKRIFSVFLVSTLFYCLVFGTSFGVSAEMKDFDYDVLNDGTANVTINSEERTVVVPSEIDGYTVSTISNIGVFTHQAWREVQIPSTVKMIGEFDYASGEFEEKNVFANMNSQLLFIRVASDNPYYCNRECALYNKSQTKIIALPATYQGSYYVPKSVKEIGAYAFNYCEQIEEISLSSGLKKIGKGAFANCESITKIKIPGTVTEIGESAFWACGSLKEVTIPDGVTSLKKNTFMWCDKLRKLKIPKSVTYIDGSLINEVTGIYDVLTIYGYRGTAAEQYANSKNIKFEPLDEESEIPNNDNAEKASNNNTGENIQVAIPEALDPSNPFSIMGQAYDTIINRYGENYTVMEENMDRIRFIYYPETDNPYEYGCTYDGDYVKALFIRNISNNPISLFDGITNLSTVSELQKMDISKKYEINDNPTNKRLKRTVDFEYQKRTLVQFQWEITSNTWQSADRVLIMEMDEDLNIQQTPKPTEKLQEEITKNQTVTTSTEYFTTEPNTTVSNETNLSNQNNMLIIWLLIAGIIVVIATLATLGIVLLRRYKKKNQS